MDIVGMSNRKVYKHIWRHSVNQQNSFSEFETLFWVNVSFLRHLGMAFACSAILLKDIDTPLFNDEVEIYGSLSG